MAEMETTTIVEIDKQIRDLYEKRQQLKKEADQIAVDKVAKLFEGKWICRRDGADEAAYFHISKVEELCDNVYQREGDPRCSGASATGCSRSPISRESTPIWKKSARL